jgi:cytochrome c553
VPRGLRRAWLAAPLLVAAAAAAPALATAGPPGASSCSGCHAVPARDGAAIPSLLGRSAEEIADAMLGFRSGARPATLMNRIALGFSDAEIRAIAAWLAVRP